ncbi:site-specific integrase [Aquitalea sp. S1-19]|nr:site-specific integrase [Aquitalea sp. S1-19]
MLFLIFLEQRGINLDERIRDGRILDLSEIEALASLCRLQIDAITCPSKPKTLTQIIRANSAERFRKQIVKSPLKTVAPQTTGTRLRVITDYLSWLLQTQLLKFPAGSPSFSTLKTNHQIVIAALKARIPESGSRNTIDVRQGLTSEIAARLLTVTTRHSSENPWKGQFIKQRNELIVRWLYAFGLRRGELLNIKISDINFREETIFIIRRADAPEDPRPEQPSVKTKDRILAIPPDLCRLTHDYVLNARRHLSGAKKHEYLFVADKTGNPMSLSAMNKCFAYLRSNITDLPTDLSPHVLRHTWNDNFSAVMDRNKTPCADEQKMRSYLMGWSETSGTAVNYTRRHIRKKANEVSLMMQAEMIKKDKE